MLATCICMVVLLCVVAIVSVLYMQKKSQYPQTPDYISNNPDYIGFNEG